MGILLFAFSSNVCAKTPKLFSHLGGDLKETFTSWPVFVLGGGAIAAAALTQADASIQNSFRNGRHMGKADSVFNVMGAPYLVDAGAVVTFAGGALARNEELTRTGEALVEALFFSESITLMLKGAFNRTRPNGGYYGFPSGHASRTFAVASVIETLYGPWVGLPSYLLAGLISFSRLDSNVHNTSDIVFGAALGSAIGWGTSRFHKKDPSLLVLPLMMKDGGGCLLVIDY